MSERSYIAIDLKSFYASVECVERKLDPLNTNLVVADESRTEKTICLAVTPSLKSYGISGRARLFEVIQGVNTVNNQRRYNYRSQIRNYKAELQGSSYIDSELKSKPELSLEYIIAPPRMALYMEYSTRIYNIYLKYIAPEDIHVYSIDEVFIDVTDYLQTYKLTPHELAMKMIQDVLHETGITATAGIGTNLYLCKVAMDIVAKHIPADKDGVRIAELDEISYRKLLWSHTPLTDFWRIGQGTAKKLESIYIRTMGELAEYSLRNEDKLFKMFGVNAELIIDHAWGYEPCTMKEIKEYRPSTNSLSQGQVLHCPYDYEKAKIIVKEMADSLSFDLVEKGLVTNQIVLTIGFDRESLERYDIRSTYTGEVVSDHYGRSVPKHAHGTANLTKYSSSSRAITKAVLTIMERVVDKNLLIRRINITANRVVRECDAVYENVCEQLDLFSDVSEQEKQHEQEERSEKRERNMQQAILKMKKKYGKNAVMRGMNYQEGATAIDRNGQVGGHKA